MSADCPSEAHLLAFVERRLAPSAHANAEEHVADCDSCRRVVAEAARDLTTSVAGDAEREGTAGPSIEPIARAATIGRYRILEPIGRGAMGVVYSAYDPGLDRRVALKLLGAERAGKDREQMTARLLREGQAMARLAHPNVVTVFDSGELDEGAGIFLAMELVDGETLGAWLAREPRPWRAVLAAFVDAGRGLAAAHHAGVVHRDFKPDNVLVGKDGRVRVTDFGLARHDGAASGEGPADLPLAVTAAGMLVGTPAYMAPEQLRGEPAGEPADVFAFSSALYQALWRQRPFAGETLAELRASVLRGEVREPPASPKLPAHVRRGILRGLRADPGARVPGMDELLSTLSVESVRRVGRTTLFLAPAILLLAAAVWWHSTWVASPPICAGGKERLAHVWDDGKKQTIARVFTATTAPYAAATVESVLHSLDGYGTAWVAAYTDACEATHRRGDQSEALLDRRMECLDDRLRELGATADSLVAADRAVLDRAVTAVGALRPLAACANREQLSALVPPPEPAARDRVDAARAILAHARALRQAGRFADGIPFAAWVTVEARALGYAPLEAEAEFELGMLEKGLGLANECQAPLENAVWAAARAGDVETGVRAATELATVLGFHLKTEDALRWAELAEAETRRLGNDPVMRAAAIGAHAFALVSANRAPEAYAEMEEAIALLRGKLGDKDPVVAAAMMRLANGYMVGGRYADSIEWQERAIDIDTAALGAEHPTTVNLMFNLTGALNGVGRPREALELGRRVLALKEATLGPVHREIALCLSNIGSSALTLGEYDEAVKALQRALEVNEKTLGADHAANINPLGILGLALAPLGRFDEALAAEHRALALAEKQFGKDSAVVAFIAAALGQIFEAAERYPEACAAFDRAATTLAKADPDHSDLAGMQSAQGRCLMRAGKLAEAQAVQEGALAQAEKHLGMSNPSGAGILVDLAKTRLAHGDAAGAQADDERAVAILGEHEVDPLVVDEGEAGSGPGAPADGRRCQPGIDRSSRENPELALRRCRAQETGADIVPLTEVSESGCG